MKNKIENLELVNLYINGKTIKEISEIFECNQETIRLRLKKEGINTSKKKNNIKCIYCHSDTTLEGKTTYGKQKYKCSKCDKIFVEDIKIQIEKRNIYHRLIKDLYIIDKLSTVVIGKMLGVSNVVIGRILRKYGLTRNHTDARILFKIESKLPINDIINDYNSGLSSLKISKKYDCSKTSVLNILKNNEIERNNIYEYTHPSINEINELYENGKSMLKISKILNIPYTTINSILHKLNIVRTDDKFGLGVNYNEWLKNLTVYQKYRRDVNKITNKQNISSLINYNKRGLAGKLGAYHLDHKYSILEGFKNGIDSEIIGNIVNLEFIPWKDNIIKKDKCSITLEELKDINIRVK